MADSNIPLKLEKDSTGKPTALKEYQAGDTMAMPGGVSFIGIARRVTGDMSSGAGAFANRLIFQSSIANSQTSITAMPNGTGAVAALQLFSSSDLENSSRGGINLIGGDQLNLWAGRSGSGAYLPVTASTSDVERWRLTVAGDFLVGTANADPISNRVSGFRVPPTGNPHIFATSGTGLSVGVQTTGTSLATFYYNNAGLAGVGSISTNGTQTSYNTSSDYRLKDDVQPLDEVEAEARIMAYRPVTWTWKSDGSRGKGFIAHWNQEVDPSTATGKKDAVRRVGVVKLPDGTNAAEGIEEPSDLGAFGNGAVWTFTEEQAVYQGRDDTKMIPDLIATLHKMRRELDNALIEIALLKRT